MNWLHRRYGLRMSRNNWGFTQRLYEGIVTTAVILLLVALYGFMSARDAEARSVERDALAYLVVVYAPRTSHVMPTVKIHEVSEAECNTLAKQVYKNVKAGKVRAFCM